jgi:hypothetical protein
LSLGLRLTFLLLRLTVTYPGLPKLAASLAHELSPINTTHLSCLILVLSTRSVIKLKADILSLNQILVLLIAHHNSTVMNKDI